MRHIFMKPMDLCYELTISISLFDVSIYIHSCRAQYSYYEFLLPSVHYSVTRRICILRESYLKLWKPFDLFKNSLLPIHHRDCSSEFLFLRISISDMRGSARVYTLSDGVYYIDMYHHMRWFSGTQFKIDMFQSWLT